MRRVPAGPPAADVAGLIYPGNGVAGSDIRLLWDGSILLPRTSQTAIWDAKFAQQTGYYALCWQTPNDGNWDSGAYSTGAHPYPTDGNVDSGGNSNGNAGSDVHYFEVAGTGGAFDFIASPSSPGPQTLFPVTKGVWYRQARVIEVIGGTTLRHTFYPDLLGSSTTFIRREFALSSLGSAGSTPAFYFGASDWTASGSANGETPNCTQRNISLFNAPLTVSDILTEGASTSNTAATSAGAAAVWYINKNPTPTDVTDKSGQGRHPRWANSNRPTLYTG